jgi:hypothetical protein
MNNCIIQHTHKTGSIAYHTIMYHSPTITLKVDGVAFNHTLVVTWIKYANAMHWVDTISIPLTRRYVPTPNNLHTLHVALSHWVTDNYLTIYRNRLRCANCHDVLGVCVCK